MILWGKWDIFGPFVGCNEAANYWFAVALKSLKEILSEMSFIRLAELLEIFWGLKGVWSALCSYCSVAFTL